jgi:glyoxylase-like metal-dependent hydrolase (beta-lactamase superfamily II)
MDSIEITRDIYQVGGKGLTSEEDAAIYLIHSEGHGALVDAGCGRSEELLLKNIRSCGVDPGNIKYLLITHCHFDHTGGAKSLKERLGCQVIAHTLDAPFLERGDNIVTAANWYGTSIQSFAVDRVLSGLEEDIHLGRHVIKGIHTPGHSPGSVVYLTESHGMKVLFAQDVHGPLHPSLLSDKADFRQSLKQLVSIRADILCEGHFGIIKGKGAVEKFIRSYLLEYG